MGNSDLKGTAINGSDNYEKKEPAPFTGPAVRFIDVSIWLAIISFQTDLPLQSGYIFQITNCGADYDRCRNVYLAIVLED